MSKPTKDESRELRARHQSKPSLRLVPKSASKAKTSPFLALTIAIETVVMAREAVEAAPGLNQGELERYKQRLAKSVLALAPKSEKLSDMASPRLVLIELARLFDLTRDALETDPQFAKEWAGDDMAEYKRRLSLAARGVTLEQAE